MKTFWFVLMLSVAAGVAEAGLLEELNRSTPLTA